MLVAPVVWVLITVVYVTGWHQDLLPTDHPENDQLIQCVTTILNKYFTNYNALTYVNIDTDNEELLKKIHSTKTFSMFSRHPTHQSFYPNLGYLITTNNVTMFAEYFEYLIMDPTWDPYARFLIIIKSLEDEELRQVFDVLLRTHVNNVVVVNGTEDAQLYTYNPFDNYMCGRNYRDVISYGVCSQVKQHLYPYKLVTGLKNCTFKASLAHRPPFSMDPLKLEGEKTILGTEEYIFKVLSEREGFNIISEYSYNADLFSTVTPNMTVVGPMSKLQNNEADVIFGGMMMITTRAQALTYLCGYHDYNDELRFAVKKSSLVPIWKTVYIEFEPPVWFSLLLSLIVYSLIVKFLLRTKDIGYVPLSLLDNLLLHGRDIRCRMTLKCVLIIWVWFAYLINTFYQSNLVSLTTNPSQEYQVSDEQHIMNYNYQPCFSTALWKYLWTETKEGVLGLQSASDLVEREECSTTLKALTTVSKNDGFYTVVPNYAYLYHKQYFTDKWGESMIYYFEKPYAKFLFGYFFYKGFPITTRLKINALLLRENGLADKSLKDIYFERTIKQRYSQKQFEVRFTLPWCVYGVGLAMSVVSFLVELSLKQRVKWNYFPKPKAKL